MISPLERAKAGLVLGGEAFVESVKRRIRNVDHRDAGRVLRALDRLHPD